MAVKNTDFVLREKGQYKVNKEFKGKMIFTYLYPKNSILIIKDKDDLTDLGFLFVKKYNSVAKSFNTCGVLQEHAEQRNAVDKFYIFNYKRLVNEVNNWFKKRPRSKFCVIIPLRKEGVKNAK